MSNKWEIKDFGDRKEHRKNISDNFVKLVVEQDGLFYSVIFIEDHISFEFDGYENFKYGRGEILFTKFQMQFEQPLKSLDRAKRACSELIESMPLRKIDAE